MQTHCMGSHGIELQYKRFISRSSNNKCRHTVWDHMEYHADSKVSRNPNFCVGCFELIISKNFAAASKMGKNGQKKICDFFCGTHFCVGCRTKNEFFLWFFFLRFGDWG